MKKLILMICVLISPAAFAANSIKATVNGMVCAFCAKGIEKKLKSLPEGKAVFVDLKSRVVVLELKAGATAPVDAFSAAITDAGYSISKVEAVEQSIADVKVDMKGNKHDENQHDITEAGEIYQRAIVVYQRLYIDLLRLTCHLGGNWLSRNLGEFS